MDVRTVTLDLSSARDRERIQVGRCRVYAVRVDQPLEIRVAGRDSKPVPVHSPGAVASCEDPIAEIYISHAAGSGTAELVFTSALDLNVGAKVYPVDSDGVLLTAMDTRLDWLLDSIQPKTIYQEPLFTSSISTREQVANDSIAWAGSEAAGTVVSRDFDNPAYNLAGSEYLVTITNPSTESDLMVRVRNEETFSGAVRYPLRDSFTIPASTPDGESMVVPGVFVGDGLRIEEENTAALTAGFTSYIRVRRV